MTNKRTAILLRKEFFPNEEIAKQYTKSSIKMTKVTMRCIHSIPQTIYHFTKRENVESILNSGLIAGLDGGIFVSTSLEENLSHLINNVIKLDGFVHPFTLEILPNEEKIEDYVIIEATPINCYRKDWHVYINKDHKNENTLFYLGDKLSLDNVKIHEASKLI